MVEAGVAGLALAGATSGKPSEAEQTVAALEHSIFHLERSNAELEAHMKEHGHDRELRQAVGENIIVIARRKAILEDLRKQAGMPSPSPPTGSRAEPMSVDVSEASAAPAAASLAEEEAGVYL